jgi:predicted outer membrane repeat protein
MNYVKRFILVVSFFLTATVFVSASGISQTSSILPKVYYVSAEGNDANNGLSEEEAFKTLSKAVTLAAAGAVKRIIILGTLDDTTEAYNDADSVFVINNSGIDEITISGKDDSFGKLLGGNGKRVICITGKSRIRFENIFISGGETEDEGGGIYAFDDGVDIILGRNAVISGNCSLEGGGIAMGNGSLIMLQNAAIKDNSVTTDEGGGAVLYCSYFKMEDDSEISGNSGGGIILFSCVGIMSDAAVISNNQCKYEGGGIVLYDADFTMSGYSQINMNKAGRNGGGICAIESKIIMTGFASINNNEADGQGGGIYISESSLIVKGDASINHNTGLVDGGGIYATESYLILDESASLKNNSSECGGGLCAGMFSNIHMTGGLVTKNSSSHGGGVYVEGATFTLSGGEITDNTADLGGGVYGDSGSVIIQDNSLVNDNKPDNVFMY